MLLPLFHFIDDFDEGLFVLDGVGVEVEDCLEDGGRVPVHVHDVHAAGVGRHVAVHDGVGHDVAEQTLDVVHHLGLVLRVGLGQESLRGATLTLELIDIIIPSMNIFYFVIS